MPRQSETESQVYDNPRFLQAGDSAVTIELGNVVDVSVNEAVAVLEKAVTEAAIEGVSATIPTYRSLQVVYDPARIRSRDLIPILSGLLTKGRQDTVVGRRWQIPVCYGGRHGMDLESVASTHNLSSEEVIRIHARAEYRVYMIGFAPGFAYLGGLPVPLHTPRRNNPRAITPARSISIGGIQAAISTMPIPSGWHLLGQTPVRTFDRRRAEPFLLQTGDQIRFKPISPGEYDRLDAMAEKGDVIAECEVIR